MQFTHATWSNNLIYWKNIKLIVLSFPGLVCSAVVTCCITLHSFDQKMQIERGGKKKLEINFQSHSEIKYEIFIDLPIGEVEITKKKTECFACREVDAEGKLENRLEVHGTMSETIFLIKTENVNKTENQIKKNHTHTQHLTPKRPERKK